MNWLVRRALFSILPLLISFQAGSELAHAAAGGVLIFGATRATGLEVAKILAARGEAVTAFVRPTSNLNELQALKIKTVTGDALSSEDVAAVIVSGRFRAIISTLGGGRGETPPDAIGTKNIVDAAKSAGVERLIVVTVIGPGNSISMVPAQQRETLGRSIALKAEAEDFVTASGLSYTIIRPGQLTSNPRSGIARLSLEPAPTGPVTRGDLADLVVKCLDDDATRGKIYQVIGDDPLAVKRMDRQ